ncbi:phosphohydrolase [bacterium]|nr:phosphohydrolase [bacterium]MBU3956231.1 phosphohydrolase [bacterium]
MHRCPGTDPRFLKVEVHKCQCGYEVEIFSDEVKAKCPKCKKDVFRENTPSCIDWCKFSRECLGEKRWHEIKKAMDSGQQDRKKQG